MAKQAVVWVALWLLAAAEAEDARGRCYDHRGRAQKCTPEFVNAAYNVRVQATNTCGERGPTEYCLQTGATGASKSCEVCDGSHPNSAHPADYLTDFNNNDNQTWWQSETMFEGIQYPTRVNLTLHLGKAFDITYVRLKFHTSRPESFAIHKRTREDGPWIPYQYYSNSCKGTYGIGPRSYVFKDNETQSLCTNEYSDISPLTGGNVAFSTLEGRPSAHNFDNSAELQEWVTATDIRITLDRINTFGDEIFGDPKVLKSYYYGISDLAVGGRCKCNGHAGECVVDPNTAKLRCRCAHFTTGADCEQCLPFYNDQPWRKATASEAYECKQCNCNGRSQKCYFDPELWEQTGHGGHCMDCSANTDGPHCERCKENFYQLEDGRCVHCGCDPVGSRSLQCNHLGECLCKPGVEGRHCDRCAANFYEFSNQGCKPCGCSTAGSIGNTPTCDPVTGVCVCKANVEGQRCDQCKPGFFDLQIHNEFGCLPCFCYGHSSICKSATGFATLILDSSFNRDKERWETLDIKGQEVPFQYNSIGQNIGVNAQGRDAVYFVAPKRYLNDQRNSYNQFLKFSLRIGEDSPRATLEDIIVVGDNGRRISQPIFGQGNPLPSIHMQEYKFRFHEDVLYGWNPRLSPPEFISILSNITAIKIKATYVPMGTGYLDNVRLESAHRAPGSDATWVEICTCPQGYVGQFCESCAPKYRREGPAGRFSRCIPCNCNGHAEYCDPDSGKCICQDNTAGDTCDRCAPGYYGNALQGTDDDCQPCPCPSRGACVILPNEQVACLQCPQGYAGHKCDLCVDGYFGDPLGTVLGVGRECSKCDCNGNIDPNAVGNCNTTTGECLKCIHNTDGDECEKCLPGYFGNALGPVKGDCRACECFPAGTVDQDELCEEMTGQCPCKDHVSGRRCDRCQEGYFGLHTGEGCRACNCDPVGALNASCDVYTGQCHCRTGVTGLRCDSCLPLHYGFSPDGCQICDCDTIGAEDPQCRPDGQCVCRPNVEGRRCERCKENTYNKQAGCVDCPHCYDLVQDAVNLHRARLAELAHLLRTIKENPKMVDDKIFEEKLDEVMQKIDKLLEDAKAAQGSESNVAEKMKEQFKLLEEVRKTVAKTHEKIVTASGLSGQGRYNVSLAEQALVQAEEILNIARKAVETEGLEALKKAVDRSALFGEQNVVMSEIARKSRQLADEQQELAEEIHSTAAEARNISYSCDSKLRQLDSDILLMGTDIENLAAGVENMAAMMVKTQKLSNETTVKTLVVQDESLALYEKVKEVEVPEFETDHMSNEARMLVEKARALNNKTTILEENLQNEQQSLEEHRTTAEDILKYAQDQKQVMDETKEDVEEALKTAKQAVSDGEQTLDDAKKTLQTLKSFDERVQNSRNKSVAALEKFDEILEKVQSAEQLTEQGHQALVGAEARAGQARDLAQDAEKLAEKTSEEAGKVRSDAHSTKTESEQLSVLTDQLNEMIESTEFNVDQNQEHINTAETLINKALESANQARDKASTTLDKVKEALNKTQSIMDQLNYVGTVGTDEQMDKLEEGLRQAEQDLAAVKAESRLAELRTAREQHGRWLRDYSTEVKQLTADVANIAEIASSLHPRCYRRVVLEP